MYQPGDRVRFFVEHVEFKPIAGTGTLRMLSNEGWVINIDGDHDGGYVQRSEAFIQLLDPLEQLAEVNDEGG